MVVGLVGKDKDLPEVLSSCGRRLSSEFYYLNGQGRDKPCSYDVIDCCVWESL
ncbi:hypothetical protein KKE26_11990 [bacterium]|nr:hypothetical protein [bacterium]